MKYTIEMGEMAMIYIPIFIKIVSAIQNLRREIHKHTDSIETA
jgi:hypothetical protein